MKTPICKCGSETEFNSWSTDCDYYSYSDGVYGEMTQIQLRCKKCFNRTNYIKFYSECSYQKLIEEFEKGEFIQYDFELFDKLKVYTPYDWDILNKCFSTYLCEYFWNYEEFDEYGDGFFLTKDEMLYCLEQRFLLKRYEEDIVYVEMHPFYRNYINENM